MNTSGSSRGIDHENVVVRKFRKNLSKDGTYNFADPARVRATDTCDCMDDGHNLLLSVGSEWACGEEKIVIVKEEKLGKDMVSVYLQVLALIQNRRRSLILCS